MKIGLLSYQSLSPVRSSYEEDRLMEEGLFLNLDIHLIDVTQVSSVEDLDHYDCFIPRTRVVFKLEENLSLLNELEQRGRKVLNAYSSTLIAKNKAKSYRCLSSKKIAIPFTEFIHSLEEYESASIALPAPHIIKTPMGTYGKGVVLVESFRSGRSVVDTLLVGWSKELIVQEFIEESEATDLRVFVIGSEIVAAMQRSAKGEEFRSNAQLGAEVSNVVLSEDEKKLAIDSVLALGLDFAGVDLIRSARGPLVLEVNANPGFQALESISGVNVAKKLIEYSCKKASSSS